VVDFALFLQKRYICKVAVRDRLNIDF